MPKIELIDQTYLNVDSLLTTFDNEWNPWTNPKEWMRRDEQLGHFTLAYVDRVANFGDEFSEKEQFVQRQAAYDAIIEAEPLTYTRVFEPTSK